MAVTLPAVPPLVTSGDLADELGSFVRHLRAGNVSPNTVYAYERLERPGRDVGSREHLRHL